MWVVITETRLGGPVKSRFDTKAEACDFARFVQMFEPRTVVSIVRDSE